MIEFILLRGAHDELRRRRIPDRRVFTRLAVPRRILLPHVPARLMLEPVISSREHHAALVAEDLFVQSQSERTLPVGSIGSVPRVVNQRMLNVRN
jgi:hypothetical protein